MSTLPDDQFWGSIMIAALAFVWLLAPAAAWAARHIVATARTNAVHRRNARARREGRATTTYWYGGQPITPHDFEAIRAARTAERDRGTRGGVA